MYHEAVLKHGLKFEIIEHDLINSYDAFIVSMPFTRLGVVHPKLYDILELAANSIDQNDAGFEDDENGVDDGDGVSDNFELYGIASAEGIPVTIVTGPPHSGEINASVVDIETVGGGIYRLPVSIELEDKEMISDAIKAMAANCSTCHKKFRN